MDHLYIVTCGKAGFQNSRKEISVVQLKVNNIDKVYIDGLCGSKTLAGGLLACFERVSHVTHILNRINKNSTYVVWLGPGIS